jgi:hypothetical protein
MGGACSPIVAAFEIVRRDWRFVFGESVSLTPVYAFVVLTTHASFLNGGLLFSTLTLSAIAIISLYAFLLLVKTKFVVSGSFGGMSQSAGVVTLCISD